MAVCRTHDEIKGALWSILPPMSGPIDGSIPEFQALWLRYLWREKTPAWVPICSSFERWASDTAPRAYHRGGRA